MGPELQRQILRALAPALKKAEAGVSAVPAQSVTSFEVTGVSGVAEDAAPLRKGHTYTLTGVQSGKAVTVAAGGTGLVLGTEAGTNARRWRLSTVRHDSGVRERYVFAHPEDGTRLAVRDDVPVAEPDTGVRDKATERIMSTTGDGTWTLVSAATGRLLEVGGQATHEGAAVTTRQPDSGADQRWTVTDVSATSTG